MQVCNITHSFVNPSVNASAHSDRICTAIPHGVCWKLSAMLQQHTPGGNNRCEEAFRRASRRYTLLRDFGEVLHLQWGLFLWGGYAHQQTLEETRQDQPARQQDHRPPGGPPRRTTRRDHQDHQEDRRTWTLTRRTTFQRSKPPRKRGQRSRVTFVATEAVATEAVEAAAKAAVAAPTTLRQQTDPKMVKLEAHTWSSRKKDNGTLSAIHHWARTRTRSTRRT
jgi:hypothetical protein